MKIGNIRRVAREDLTDAPKGEWLDILLTSINQALEQITQALQQNLSITDNTTSAIKSFRMTHGEELLIKNPLSGRPRGIVHIGVTATATGSREVVASFDWSFSNDGNSQSQLKLTATFVSGSGTADVNLLFIGG
jgi:hypothetical protein